MKYELDFIDQIIKAYDVRGLVENYLTPDFVFDIGQAFAMLVKSECIVVGHDMRPSSPELVRAFSEGVNLQGTNVINIGLCSTDQLYFATGKLKMPGAMFTASHNPAPYNGIKMAQPFAKPIGRDSGLGFIRQVLVNGIYDEPDKNKRGVTTFQDLLEEYAQFLNDLVDCKEIRPLKVVIDAGNGMAGHTAPKIFANLPIEVIPMFFELDGTFPNHEANPIDAANLVDLQASVLANKADLGLAFDGDADRCFLVDEKGDLVDPSLLSALIAQREIIKNPGATIIYSLISSRIVPETILANGGKPLRSRVGHSFIKSMMAESGAVFAGEHSGHFYFEKFWGADSGALAALHTLAALGSANTGTTLSQLLSPYAKYVQSGEINTKVGDIQEVILKVKANYLNHPDLLEIDELDGLMVISKKWWFNLRGSNTEPLLRLNVEGDTGAIMTSMRDEVLEMIAKLK
jgi:phosphomannomutase